MKRENKSFLKGPDAIDYVALRKGQEKNEAGGLRKELICRYDVYDFDFKAIVGEILEVLPS